MTRVVRGVVRKIFLVGAIASAGFIFAPMVRAENSTSVHYEASEFSFGAGSESKTCSGSYCASVSIGDTTAQNEAPLPSSASFEAIPKDSEPLLEVIVDPGTSNLGELSTTKTATKTMTVRINAFLIDGYTLQINGQPPKYGSHTLKALTNATEAKPGVEQFGLNVVANTIPKVGLDPVKTSDTGTNTSMVEPDYAIANQFKYSDGAVIARSGAGSGKTDFTVSMIVNIAGNTPAGRYSGDYSAVVVPRF